MLAVVVVVAWVMGGGWWLVGGGWWVVVGGWLVGGGGWYEYRSRQNRLVGRKNRQTYQLGDAVQVRVMNVDVLRNQIDLEVISQSSNGSTEPESSAPESSEPLPVALSER